MQSALKLSKAISFFARQISLKKVFVKNDKDLFSVEQHCLYLIACVEHNIRMLIVHISIAWINTHIIAHLA